MANEYNALEERFRQMARLQHAMTFLQWDQLVMMPPGGNDTRAKSIAELSGMHHELLSAPEIGELIAHCSAQEQDQEIQASLAEMAREHRLATAIPSDLVKAQSLAGSKCEHGWREQRGNNDWQGFLNNFEHVINLSRQEAAARMEASANSFHSPYDALLDLYCTGDSSALISTVFDQLKVELPPLIHKIMEKQNGREIDLSPPFAISDQEQLNRELMALLGFDFQRGRMDVSMHPFSTGDTGDHRITTRFREDDFIEALLATAHETGHASYEMGLPQRWEGLPVGRSRNMSIHESQSLLFEKQLILSKPYLEFFTRTIHHILKQTQPFSANEIWNLATRVRPNLIRVEADEATYPLHVILRFEIESSLINGHMEGADIPDAWNQKMQQYLGLSTDGNYRDGCLQDIHWTDGSFGYFPSYTLGALNAAQLFHAFRQNHADWRERFRIGDISFLRQWLTENVWSKGSFLSSQEIMEQATGHRTEASFFLNHLHERYLEE